MCKVKCLARHWMVESNSLKKLWDYCTQHASVVRSHTVHVTEFRQPLQVQSHPEMPRILLQLGHIRHT